MQGKAVGMQGVAVRMQWDVGGRKGMQGAQGDAGSAIPVTRVSNGKGGWADLLL